MKEGRKQAAVFCSRPLLKAISIDLHRKLFDS
jgi:hypothetical protein